MSQNEPDVISRNAAIDLLREELVKHTDDATSICQAAANEHIFCQGFQGRTDAELRADYAWIVRKRPGMSRAELETIANLWQLTQQEVQQLPLACDVQARAGDMCGGWRGLTNEQLSRYYFELTGRLLRVS